MIVAAAKILADRIVEIFTPHVECISIAGSIRRMKPEVKDIEIVALPKKHATDLFNAGGLVVEPGFKQAIETIAAKIIKGKPDGRYMQIVLKGRDEMKLDLFMPEKDDYYRQYAIRTGSADYSAKVIAAGWVAKGWCGSDKGLRLQSDCHALKDVNGKITGWRCMNTKGEKPPVWQSEEHFFEWIGVRWMEANLRSV